MSSWDLYADKKYTSDSETQQSFEFSFSSSEKKQSVMAPKTISHKTVAHKVKKNRLVDSILSFKAWPVGELSEIRSKKEENILHLLLPLLSKLSSENRWITLISPPAHIDKKLFAYHGIDVSRVLLIHPKDAVDDTATMNKALKNGTSGIVIMWTDKLPMRFVAQWRKSVKQGNCRGVIVNHDPDEHCSPSVALALDVKSSDKAIIITASQKFGRKTNYQAKRSFPIINLDNLIPDFMEAESFCLVN